MCSVYGLPQDFLSERPVILSSVGAMGILKYRLTMARCFGQPNVTANPSVETDRFRPGRISVALIFKKQINVVDNFIREPRSAIEHAINQTGKHQPRIKSPCNQIDCSQQFAEAVQRKEMGLQRKEHLVSRRQRV